jgi:hypothetical protein
MDPLGKKYGGPKLASGSFRRGCAMCRTCFRNPKAGQDCVTCLDPNLYPGPLLSEEVVLGFIIEHSPFISARIIAWISHKGYMNQNCQASIRMRSRERSAELLIVGMQVTIAVDFGMTGSSKQTS